MKNLTNNYKVENLFIKSMKKVEISLSNYSHNYDNKYEIEDQLSEEEKLKIFDYHKDGLGSYLLEKIRLYNEDCSNGTIKKSKNGRFIKSSLNKWLRENDPRNALRLTFEHHYITYYLNGNEFRMTEMTPRTTFISHKMLWDEKPVINQWFHLLLKELEKLEDIYYKEHDLDQINKQQLKSLLLKYHYLLDQQLVDNMYETVSDRNVADLNKVSEYLELLTNLDQEVQKTINKVLDKMTIK